MIIYIYSKCSTCQKALMLLRNRKIIFTSKEIIKETPSIEELQKVLDDYNGNIKKLINTSGQLYREMQLASKLKEMPLSQILMLLNQHGMLIKRPFLITESGGVTGFNEAEWSKRLLI